MNAFLVDTNFFIQAHRAIYPLDVAVSFWRKVRELAEAQKVISIDKVKNEIYQNEDDLKQWCTAHLPEDFFKSTNTIIGEYGSVAAWANSMRHQYKPTALTEFLDADEADAWLVSYALNQGIPLITYEKSEPNSKKKIKIPDVCIHFGVHHMSTIDMFRSLGESF